MKNPNLDKYQEFIFEDYKLNRETGELSLKYSFDDIIHFEEKVYFPVEKIDWSKVNLEALKLALDNLHLMMGISYYKAYVPSKMVLKKTELSVDQAIFWKKIYQRGLGEFFYKNNIDFNGLINFPFDEELRPSHVHLELTERSLVPIGGGKDSLATAEMLNQAGENFDYFTFKDELPIKETAAILGKNRLLINRKIDPQIIELNNQGAFNGHIPISAVISFLMIVCGVLYDYKYFILSLEKSANYGQIDYLGMDINHQYSKSYEFEQDFSEYIARYISPDLHFFSFLRPFYEIRIAKIFANNPNFEKYAPIFTSCNRNFKLYKKPEEAGKWCGKCPKCAFVFAILAPFVDKNKLIEIFGGNLFDDAELVDLFRELSGYKDIKPFECVGTPEEMIAAFDMVATKGDYADSAVIKMYLEEIKPDISDAEKIKEEVLKIHESVTIPSRFLNILYEFS
ncbi:hypothetical protein GF376_02440 [Candidatus Peregrinibacteria bacterium]|nr:hypothetical protein [Candidatus Peregrinibacteria bacterium]